MAVCNRPSASEVAAIKRDAGAQPVHVVEQVEGVGQADHPDQRAGHVQGHRLEPVEPVVEEQQHRRQRDLRDQLGRRLQRHDVVDQSDAEHQQRADDQDGNLGGDAADERHHEQRQPNADAAEQRHRPTMPAILARLGDVAKPDRGGAAHRDHGRAKRANDSNSSCQRWSIMRELPEEYREGTSGATAASARR